MDIKKLHEMYKNKEITVYDFINQSFEKIDENNINSFITLDKEKALEKAKELDKKLEEGCEISPLFGVPYALKDNIITDGLLTTAGSHTLSTYIPIYDATVTKKLKESDGILIGKANMDEYAMGGSSETSYYGVTLNPLDRELIPGGSSSGSAAAIAAGEVLVSLGTDTGGSVRNPANFCNVVGMAPTYGAISRYGTISMANSFDRVGVLGNTVEDAKIIFDIVKGKDDHDFTTVDLDPARGIESLEGVKIAYVKIDERFESDKQIIDLYNKALDMLREKGAVLKEVEIKYLENINQIYTVIMAVEVSANMARIDGIRFGASHSPNEGIDNLFRKNRSDFFGDEMKRRIALGNYFSSKESGQLHYKQALKVRSLFRDSIESILEDNEFIISPTNLKLPYKIGSREDDANAAFDSGTFNTITNIIDLPAISIPTDEKLIGSVQVIGRRFKDEDLFDLASLMEGGLK